MVRIERSIEIKRTAKEIWSLTSLDKFPDYIRFFKRVEWTSKAIDETGSTADMTIQVWENKINSELRMTEVVKNERRTWLAVDENMETAGLMVFSPTETGTRLTVVLNYDFPKSEFGRLMLTVFSVFKKKIEKDVERGLKKLKDTVEKAVR